jgi:hypothetical protein
MNYNTRNSYARLKTLFFTLDEVMTLDLPYIEIILMLNYIKDINIKKVHKQI